MEEDLCERVRRQSLEMPGARQSIADFLVQEGSGIKNLTMSEVADLTFTSKPSLVRFAKALGFDGWRSFRLAYVEAVERSERDRVTIDPNYPFVEGDTLSTVLNNVSALEHQALGEARADIDEEALLEAARRIVAAKTLVFFGLAPNSYYGELFAFKLLSLSKTCLVPDEAEWEVLARGLGEGDCAIICSYSGVGPQRPPVSLVTPLKAQHVPIVAITNSGSNWLKQESDCVLSFVPREHYYGKISGYYSETCVSFILDALFSACFAADYAENEINRLRVLVNYERRRVHHIDDVLPL